MWPSFSSDLIEEMRPDRRNLRIILIMVNWSVIFLCGIQKKYTAVVPKRLGAITDALIYQFQFSKVSIAIHLFLPNVTLYHPFLIHWGGGGNFVTFWSRKSRNHNLNSVWIAYATIWRYAIQRYEEISFCNIKLLI